MAVHPGPRFLDADAFATLQALCDRILPQGDRAQSIPLAAHVDEKLWLDKRAGYRNAKLPPVPPDMSGDHFDVDLTIDYILIRH